MQNLEVWNLWHQKLTNLDKNWSVFIKFSTYREIICVKSRQYRDKLNSPIYTKKYFHGLKKSRRDSQSVLKKPKKTEKKPDTFLHGDHDIYLIFCTQIWHQIWLKYAYHQNGQKWPKKGAKNDPFLIPLNWQNWGCPKIGGVPKFDPNPWKWPILGHFLDPFLPLYLCTYYLPYNCMHIWVKHEERPKRGSKKVVKKWRPKIGHFRVFEFCQNGQF